MLELFVKAVMMQTPDIKKSITRKTKDRMEKLNKELETSQFFASSTLGVLFNPNVCHDTKSQLLLIQHLYFQAKIDAIQVVLNNYQKFNKRSPAFDSIKNFYDDLVELKRAL